MPAVSTRCDVSEVELIVYERTLHPELTDAVERKVERHGGAELVVAITPTGHQLVWSCGETVLTELVGVPGVKLPRCGCAARHRVAEARDVNHTLASGCGYYAAAQVEAVDDDTFARLDQEIDATGRQTELSHEFGGSNRLRTPARSVLTIEPMDDSLVVHAVHTYPASRTIVRTQSLFELPS